MNNAILIGLCGKAGSGKDTTAEVVVDQLRSNGREVVTLSFAQKLKEVTADVFGVPIEVMNDRVMKNTPMAAFGGRTPRQALQYIGTEGFRTIRENVWVDYAMRRAKSLLYNNISVVVTDVRFINEAKSVKCAGGVVIVLKRDLVEIYDHQSETEIDVIALEAMVDQQMALVDNNGSMDDLKSAVLAIVEQM